MLQLDFFHLPLLLVIPLTRICLTRRTHAEDDGGGQECANDEGFDVDVFHGEASLATPPALASAGSLGGGYLEPFEVLFSIIF